MINRSDVLKLHAYCIAALHRPWSETDLIEGAEVARAHHVDFMADCRPYLTEEGVAILTEAVAAMKERL